MFSSPAKLSSSSSSELEMIFFDSASSSSSSSSSTASSTCSSAVHASSLVDPSTHSPALIQLINMKITKGVIEYVVGCVSETVDFAMGRTPAPSLAPASPTSSRNSQGSPYHTKFTAFVTTVLFRAKVAAPTVLTSLVYITRARPHLSIPGEEWALERVFLGALIAVFGKRDVGRIEREFLDVLDWELGIRQGDPARTPRGACCRYVPLPFCHLNLLFFCCADEDCDPRRRAPLRPNRHACVPPEHGCRRPGARALLTAERPFHMSTPAPLPYKLSSASSYNLNPRTTPSPSTTQLPCSALPAAQRAL
ncbi:hypothetical protein B0H14DRAFT_3866128 [Mycena olivaceomarginata]|nr:hypothetical protein B0H14DRAFT_3866128 [Mycena olivaceomarginata]